MDSSGASENSHLNLELVFLDFVFCFKNELGLAPLEDALVLQKKNPVLDNFREFQNELNGQRSRPSINLCVSILIFQNFKLFKECSLKFIVEHSFWFFLNSHLGPLIACLKKPEIVLCVPRLVFG